MFFLYMQFELTDRHGILHCISIEATVKELRYTHHYKFVQFLKLNCVYLYFCNLSDFLSIY